MEPWEQRVGGASVVGDGDPAVQERGGGAPPRVLVVEDDQSLAKLLSERLGRRGFEAQGCGSMTEALALLSEADFEAVVSDINLGAASGIDLCRRLAESRPNLPVIVITAFGSLEVAVESIRAGAFDFLSKPFELEALVLALERALQHRRLRAEVNRLRQTVPRAAPIAGMVGESEAMRRVFDLVARLAVTDAAVLITGESGTGKELVARALHQRSPRAAGPFLAVSCAAVPETLLEAELFGHQRGAFTDAKTSRDGLLLQADGGTLLLDEVGDMPLSLQPKLLRALEERRVRPLGSERERAFDVRVIAATNVDLEAAVDRGAFRGDLYYRINVVQINLPPLHQRGNDVLLLAQHFATEFARQMERPVVGLSARVVERLLRYSWPGNVRELRNCIERAVALAQQPRIGVEDLPDRVREPRPTHLATASAESPELLPMREVERQYIRRVLASVGGSRTAAARILGFDRKTLYRKLVRYGLSART